MSIDELILGAVWTGALSAALMDVWALLLRRTLGIQGLDYGLLGRWIGHFTALRFRHQRIAAASVIPAERAIGWIAHYGIAIAFAFGFLAIVGHGGCTVVCHAACNGHGVRELPTPSPHWSRLRNLVTHLVFGIGLYGAAVLMALV